MSEEIDTQGVGAVLAGIISGSSIESIKKELLAQGLSHVQVEELIARGLTLKGEMKDEIESLRVGQMQHPKRSAPPNGKYFEVPVNSADNLLCSDKECPCTEQAILDPGKTGYLYISQEVVKMRRDALIWEELIQKVRDMRERLGATIMFDSGTVNPIFLCEQGARLRNLDLEISAADAANWVKTGSCPLRRTPTNKQWWQFWK